MVASGLKMEIKSLTPVGMIILRPAKDLTYPSGPSSFLTADHGTITLSFTKYK
jgi:hypothetical protein